MAKRRSVQATIKDRVVEMRKVHTSELMDHAGNFRRHPGAQKDAMRGILEEVGIAGALVLYYSQRNGGKLTAIDGHMRKNDFPGEWPCVITNLTDDEADKLLLVHDPVGAMAEADGRAMEELMHNFDTENEALLDMLSEMSQDNAITGPKERGGDGDADATIPELYQVVVECDDEDEQREVFDRLHIEGRDCKLMTVAGGGKREARDRAEPAEIKLGKNECAVECPIHDSFRVQQVAGMFDVSLKKKSQERFVAELPEDDDWKIGVIVGPSGSGKSTVARQTFGEHLYSARDWPTDKAIVDCFGELSINDISAMLTAVGFSSPPAWVRPYHVLSNGQKFRCDLARAMLEGGSLVAFDEFTSVVDRTVAKIGSAAVAKAVRSGRACERFVAVACHYDIIEWLEPDWVLDMASGKLARGSLWRRPPINLRVYRSSHKHWRLFAKHHYLDASDITGATCYVGEIDDTPACFVAVRHSAGFKGIKRISRIVTMPDFQGVGVGMACLNAVAQLTLRKDGVERVTITTGHPAMMHALQRSTSWSLSDFLPTGSAKHAGKNRGSDDSSGRAVARFEFLQG